MKKMVMRRIMWPLVSSGTAWLATAAAEKLMDRRARRGRKHGMARTMMNAAVATAAGALAEGAVVAMARGRK
jgi:hypothetical protein